MLISFDWGRFELRVRPFLESTHFGAYHIKFSAILEKKKWPLFWLPTTTTTHTIKLPIPYPFKRIKIHMTHFVGIATQIPPTGDKSQVQPLMENIQFALDGKLLCSINGWCVDGYIYSINGFSPKTAEKITQGTNQQLP